MVSFSFPCFQQGEFFFNTNCEDRVELLWLDSLAVFNSRSCPHWASRFNYSLGFPTLALVLAEVSTPVSCDSPYLPVSLIWETAVYPMTYDLTSLKHLRRNVDFLVCSAFYLLLEWQLLSCFLRARLETRDSEFWDTFLINASFYECFVY